MEKINARDVAMSLTPDEAQVLLEKYKVSNPAKYAAKLESGELKKKFPNVFGVEKPALVEESKKVKKN